MYHTASLPPRSHLLLATIRVPYYTDLKMNRVSFQHDNEVIAPDEESSSSSSLRPRRRRRRRSQQRDSSCLRWDDDTLYGRQAELQVLHAAYQKVVNNGTHNQQRHCNVDYQSDDGDVVDKDESGIHGNNSWNSLSGRSSSVRSLSSSSVVAVYVGGYSGAGKTRLVETFRREVLSSLSNIENNGAPWPYNQMDRLNWVNE